MSKRSQTLDVVNSPTKRTHYLSSTHNNIGITLYDEVVLKIFSHLTSHQDLCAVQQTNSNWARLSLDNQQHAIRREQLWRALYLREFGRSRLRGSKGFPVYANTRSDGREVRPLPNRAQSYHEGVKDWKWMFRISSNWRKGRCVLEELTWQAQEDLTHSIHVALSGGFIITASSSPSPSPGIFLHRPQKPPHVLTASLGPFDASTRVTALALDQSQTTTSGCRLAVFYSSGIFCLFLTFPSDPTESRELLSYHSIARRHRITSVVVQAVYHHPLLITLSSTFDLTLYELPPPGHATSGVRLTQTLTSFTSYPPTSLILSNPLPSAYKLILAYSVPTYPSHWTIAVTELTISSFTVQSTQTSRALDLNPGWTPLTREFAETLRDQYSRKVSEVSCISTDGKYLVLAGDGTTTIQLYRLATRSRTSIGAKLTFLRTLYGHVSSVQALCVADGRCVSLSRDGSLWVWDLDRGGVEVDSTGLMSLPETARVVFDERRILIVLNGKILLKKFDI